MTSQRARTGTLPRWLANQEGRVPQRAIFVQMTLSALLLGAVSLGWISLEDLVSTSNLFFLGNALLGLAAAGKLLTGWGVRSLIGVLAVVLVVLLAQGQPAGWALFGTVAGATWLQARLSSAPS
jgi:surface polysaccharide O-acyltransferase-like enzyme